MQQYSFIITNIDEKRVGKSLQEISTWPKCRNVLTTLKEQENENTVAPRYGKYIGLICRTKTRIRHRSWRAHSSQ